MTIRNLDGLFRPRSVAVVGPSPLPAAVLDRLLAKLVAPPRAPRVTLVGLEPSEAAPALQRVDNPDHLAQGAADLAFYVGTPEAAADTVAALGARGCRVVVLTAPSYAEWPAPLVKATLQAARRHTVRLIGPGSIGVQAPAVGLDGSLMGLAAPKGDLGLISRSGAIINATLAVASARGFGFSSVISLGQKTDVDVGDLLDSMAADGRTRAILIHLESVTHPAKFLSAARAAARTKPVIVIRAGSGGRQSATALTHAGRLADPDAVFAAALARAGVLSVTDIDEMLDAAETVSRYRSTSGRRLGVVANGRSLGAIAADRLAYRHGRLAVPEEATLEKLAGLVRPMAQPANPAILADDAAADHVGTAVSAFLADHGTDGVLAVVAPGAFSSTPDAAEAIAKAAEANRKRNLKAKPVLAVMPDASQESRRRLSAAGVLVRDGSGAAIDSFLHLSRYAEGQEQLMETPPSMPDTLEFDTARARAIIEAGQARGDDWLTTDETAELLTIYGVPLLPSVTVTDVEAAVVEATRLFADGARRLVVKLEAPAISSKTAISGLRTGLATPEEVRVAAGILLRRVEEDPILQPLVSGLVIQPMADIAKGLELLAGIADDGVFGPVVMLARGGTGAEAIGDRVVDLPPLDLALAGRMLARTRLYSRLLRDPKFATVDREPLMQILVKLSQMAADLEGIAELEIDPLMMSGDGIVALDARTRIRPAATRTGRGVNPRLVIRPYPRELERIVSLKDGSHLFVRPVRPEDEPAFKDLFEHVTADDLRLRFFAPVREFSHAFLARLTQLDYARAMAFAAFEVETGTLLGGVRLHCDPDHGSGEYAVLVRSDQKGKGLGWVLMGLIIDYARADGINTITGEVLRENHPMLDLCRSLGFTVHPSPDDDAVMEVVLDLTSPADDLKAAPGVD